MMEERMRFRRINRGWSLAELLAVLSLLSIVFLGLPALAQHLLARHRPVEIMQRMANLIMRIRTQAISKGRLMALRIESDRTREDHYRLLICGDGNANGIHEAEIFSGVDPCRDSSVPLQAPGIMMLKPLPDGFRLPGKRLLATNDAPVRWGPHEMLICTPWGRCTSGTIIWTRSHHRGYRALRFDGARGIIQTWDSQTGWTWNLRDTQ